MRPIRSALTRVVVAFLSLGAVSCGESKQKPTYPTEGKLLFNGEPAANVTVFLNPVDTTAPNATRAFATTTADGTFSLTTYAAYDGAPEGEYVVTLLYEPLTSPLSRPKGKPPSINKLYTNPATSPLRAKIEKKAKNQLEPFDIK